MLLSLWYLALDEQQLCERTLGEGAGAALGVQCWFKGHLSPEHWDPDFPGV